MAPPATTAIYEGENLTISSSSGDVANVIDNAECSNGKFLLYKSDVVGDYVSFSVDVAQPGTYSISIDFWGINNRGTIQLSINGSDVGLPIDEHTVPDGLVTNYVIGNYTFDSGGIYTFTFTNVTRNLNSGAHKFSIDLIRLEPVNNARIAAESTISDLVDLEEVVVAAYPNPFKSIINIQFQLRSSSYVELLIYNLSGEIIADLLHEKVQSGTHTVAWDVGGLNSLPSGTYIFKLITGNEHMTRKILLDK